MALKVKRIETIEYEIEGLNLSAEREKMGLSRLKFVEKLGGVNNGWYYKLVKKLEKPGKHRLGPVEMQEILKALGTPIAERGKDG